MWPATVLALPDRNTIVRQRPLVSATGNCRSYSLGYSALAAALGALLLWEAIKYRAADFPASPDSRPGCCARYGDVMTRKERQAGRKAAIQGSTRFSTLGIAVKDGDVVEMKLLGDVVRRLGPLKGASAEVTSGTPGSRGLGPTKSV